MYTNTHDIAWPSWHESTSTERKLNAHEEVVNVSRGPIHSSSEHFQDHMVFNTVKSKQTRRKEKVTLIKMLMHANKSS